MRKQEVSLVVSAEFVAIKQEQKLFYTEKIVTSKSSQ